MNCKYAGACSACDWIQIPYEEQLQKKSKEILNLLGRDLDIEVVSVGTEGIRDRLDFTFVNEPGESPAFGLYSHEKRSIIDIDECPILDSGLQNELEAFRKNLPPLVRKGSVRIRKSREGKVGYWFDFANVDIKSLLDEKNWLGSILAMGHVEIGQKHKALEDRAGTLKLGDPKHFPWFTTYLNSAKDPLDLHCTVASFTQASRLGNQALVHQVNQRVTSGKWLELFGGIGNFTLPLTESADQVDLFEVNEIALNGLAQTLKSFSLADNITIQKKNLYGKSVEANLLAGYDGVLVDPPRSGLGALKAKLSDLKLEDRPKNFVYVSCFPETLAEDILELESLGYELNNLTGVDQFAQSHHCEWVAGLTRKP